jgi:hypothetical protein
VQQDCELLALARQLPTDFLDIQAHIFRMICDFMGDERGMVDERIFARRDVHICEENGPADPVLQGIVSDMAVASKSGGDLDKAEQRWASVAADNYAATSVTVILFDIGRKAVN